MADIINLRQVRRRLRRAADAQDAAGNRARFGRTRAERAVDDLQAEQARRSLDGARLDQDEAGTANRAKDSDTTS